jgi:hypothetical protein
MLKSLVKILCIPWLFHGLLTIWTKHSIFRFLVKVTKYEKIRCPICLFFLEQIIVLGFQLDFVFVFAFECYDACGNAMS